MDDFGVPLFLETPKSCWERILFLLGCWLLDSVEGVFLETFIDLHMAVLQKQLESICFCGLGVNFEWYLSPLPLSQHTQRVCVWRHAKLFQITARSVVKGWLFSITLT